MQDDAILFDEDLTESSPVINDQLREFVMLDQERRVLEKSLKKVKERIDALEPKLLTGFEAGKLRNVTMDGLTVFVHRQLWANAKDGDYERACAALKQAGLGEFVHERFNTNVISAYFRELDAQGEVAVPVLQEAIEVTEKFSLRTRLR